MELDTVETLAILGGIGAVLSPIIAVSRFWIIPIIWQPFYYLSQLGFLLLLLSFLGGIVGCIMAVRSGGFVKKMPQRAAWDLKYVGIVVLVVGILAPVNIFQIISGSLILIAGVDVGETWMKIQRARGQTGWPYATVATAVGSDWTRRLSCRFCGAPLVVRAVKARNHLVLLKTKCALDKTSDVIRLPLAQLESWLPSVADRIHRCEKCGERTVALLVERQDANSTYLHPYCPNGHPNRNYRIVWTPMYPHLARSPAVGVGVQSQIQPQVRPQVIPVTQPISISARVTQTNMRDLPIQYCSNCGVRINYSDKFCYRCGSQIQ
ncbi:MAG: hypothetical protein Q6364_01055 [Candidatus Hermodarchaeota archaeon]|nr:hypothetical protein [Candidatus Hermodarchaeota archaeon]